MMGTPVVMMPGLVPTPLTDAACRTPYRAWNHPYGGSSPQEALTDLARTLERQVANLSAANEERLRPMIRQAAENARLREALFAVISYVHPGGDQRLAEILTQANEVLHR